MQQFWRSGKARPTARIWGPALLISAAALLATPWLIGPRCPNHVVIATGSPDGAYYDFANQYRLLLAKQGITVDVLATKGSVENSERLSRGTDNVSLALIQGGISPKGDTDHLESLASLYLEPVWVFCRSNEPVDDFEHLRGKRISIGPEGSGTREIAKRLLADNKMAPHASVNVECEIVDWGTHASVEGLKSGEIDAAFFVISPNSPIVHELLLADGIQLMNFRRAAAYRRRYPFLSSVTLPEGLIDFEKNIPSRDTVLLAPSANLVARDDLHHALVPLLLQTAEQVHESGGLLAFPESFPSPNFVDHPLNPTARRYFRSGPTLFYRYLPFWLAAWLDRVKILLLPLCTLLLPLLKVAPPVYRWRIRSKIFRWYRVLREVEQKLKDAGPETDFRTDMERLRNLEAELSEVSVPLSYMAEFYDLHLHIMLVQNKLQMHGQTTGNTGVRKAA